MPTPRRLIRAAVSAAATKAAGGSTTDMVAAAAKGATPRIMHNAVDRIVTPENISRVKTGIRDVVDSTRSSTFVQNAASQAVNLINKIPKQP